MEAAHHYRVSRSELLSWDPEDIEYALALMDIHRDTCQGCGQLLSESTLRIDLYSAHGLRCGGCLAIDKRQHKAREDGQDLTAVKFWARRDEE